MLNLLFLDKTKKILKEKYRFILFCLVFILVCVVFKFDNQHLNYALKRGIVLEYSLDYKTDINVEKIEKKLIEKNIKYSYVKSTKNNNSKTYDYEDKKIENITYIGLPILPNKKNEELINDISDFIFDNYKNAKLLNIKTIYNNYHKPYLSFLNFVGLFIISSVIWFLILFLVSDSKEFIKKTSDEIKANFKNLKEKITKFIKNTKEKGFKYFLKKIFFDETCDENGNEKEPDVLKETINTIVFVIVCVILIRYFIGELRWIPSGSMRPTILEKDRVFVEKLNFPTKKEIKRGDIIVFYPPEVKLLKTPWAIFARLSGIMCKDIAFIKRVIGMPNEKFEVKYDESNGEYRIFINDKPLNEPYIISRQNWTPCSEQMFCGPFIIPENHYFMMGDNRGNSQDSRFWGFLPKDRIIGRANFMFWPIPRINGLKDNYLILHKEKENTKYSEEKFIINRYEFLYKI